MLKSHRFIVFLMVCMLLGVNIAYATEIMPRADLEFDSAYPALLTTKQVTFRGVTYETKNYIKVTEVWLEKQVNGNWVKVADLTPPTKIATNTFVYSTTVDYANQIGYGTFRVWATFDADGHTITRSSNDRTFY